MKNFKKVKEYSLEEKIPLFFKKKSFFLKKKNSDFIEKFLYMFKKITTSPFLGLTSQLFKRFSASQGYYFNYG